VNAVPHAQPRLLPMTIAQLDAVVLIESAAYEFPWTRGNFVDSIAAGYIGRVLCGAHGEVLGYFVAMKGVDELHLLNLTVAPLQQGRGLGRRLLEEVVALCRAQQASRLWLEVRESNARGRNLYLRFGFRHLGVRRGYYPAAQGRREDAAVMSLTIDGASDGLE
jgi:ribosomal-protein-alanine N-acetyltransferase